MKRWVIFAAAGITGVYPAVAASAPEALKVTSNVGNMRIVSMSKLPGNHKHRTVEDYCSSYVIAKPKSAGGRLAAKKGWIVTSETKLGAFDAVTFVGRLDPATSATCSHVNGNLAIFDGIHLRAIAYWRNTTPHHVVLDPARGDVGPEDSLGYADQIDQTRIRLHSGLPSWPFADVVLRDGIFVEPTANKDSVCGGAASIPNIYGEEIQSARKKLRAFGWLPRRSTEDPDALTAELRKQGILEADGCAGTGYGFCSFAYEKKDGVRLGVGTADDPPIVLSYAVTCGVSKQPITHG